MRCEDCEQDPCRCAEWEEDLRRADLEEASRAADFAETMLPELWVKNLDGLLVRKKP